MNESFSASEINKFCYCRLKWYYERTYGARQLNEWRKELNEEMGWDAPEGESEGAKLLKRGREFHSNYDKRYRTRLALRRIIIVAALAVFIFLLWFFIWKGTLHI